MDLNMLYCSVTSRNFHCWIKFNTCWTILYAKCNFCFSEFFDLLSWCKKEYNLKGLHVAMATKLVSISCWIDKMVFYSKLPFLFRKCGTGIFTESSFAHDAIWQFWSWLGYGHNIYSKNLL